MVFVSLCRRGLEVAAAASNPPLPLPQLLPFSPETLVLQDILPAPHPAATSPIRLTAITVPTRITLTLAARTHTAIAQSPKPSLSLNASTMYVNMPNGAISTRNATNAVDLPSTNAKQTT